MKLIDLNGKWNGQCYRDGKHDFSFTGTVPGCVHTDLMGSRIPEHIYYRDNADKCQWIEDCDWKYIKQEHLTQVAFFQHERLVHLIVTITFAILELLTVCAYVIVGAIDSALSMPLLVLAIAILILLVPYIKHYYLLENEVQKMYKQYDMICEKERKL